MTDAAAAAPPAAAAEGAAEETETEDRWGRVWDAAGILAGVALVVIVIDIATDGRFISRWFHRRDQDQDQAAEPAPAPAPTEEP